MKTIRVYRGSVFFVLMLAMTIVLSGCAELFSFSSSSRGGEGDVYYADFPDVPIPAEMQLRASRSLVVKNSSGLVTGYLEFSGSASWDSLVNASASNLTRDGWSVMGLFRGERSLIVADKIDRICVITIVDGFPSTSMSVWVTSKTHGFIAPIPAPERIVPDVDDGDTFVTTTTGTSGGGSGLQEQGLFE